MTFDGQWNQVFLLLLLTITLE